MRSVRRVRSGKPRSTDTSMAAAARGIAGDRSSWRSSLLPFPRGDLREERKRIEALRSHRDHAIDGLKRSADDDRGIAVENSLETAIRRRANDDVGDPGLVL